MIRTEKSSGSSPGAEIPEDLWCLLALSRFLLAIWVLFAHTYNFGPAERAMPVPSSNALVAVYCFLAISGFSIRHSITRRPESYAIRRFWRIAPTHMLSVAIAIVAYLWLGPVLFDGRGNPWPTPPLEGWISAALLLQGVLPQARLPILFPTWSLSLECIYYCLGPILRRRGELAAAALLLASFFFCLVRPHISDLYVGSDTYGISAAALLWAWLCGWLLYRRDGSVWLPLLAGGAGSVCIVVDSRLSGAFNHVVWWATVGLCCLGRGNFLRPPLRSFMQYLGELSYPLYLLHYPVLFIAFNAVLKSNPMWNHGWLHVLIALVATMIWYRFGEAPIRAAAARSSHRGRS